MFVHILANLGFAILIQSSEINDPILHALEHQRPLLQDVIRPDRVDVPPSRVEYLGRSIAQTMHWTGAWWLWRETRENEENVSKLLSELAIGPGMTVCDFGSGSGYHAIPMAKLVGAEGRVIAVDIQSRMLDLLKTQAETAGVDNILRVLSQSHTAFLPKASCDLILLVDVYHEVSHPSAILQHLRQALTENGVIALVEFRTEDPDVPIKELHKMSKQQIAKEFTANGLKLKREYDELPWQHLQFFARDPEWTAESTDALVEESKDEVVKTLSKSKPKRPNILFIFSDDHATDAIGAYDGRLKSVNPTPNIDHLASQGMLFRQSFCTNSICGPSRAVILTGKHSHKNGFLQNGNVFDGGQDTFIKRLGQSHYQTAMIGKWHLESEPQGFDYWDILPGQGDYYNPMMIRAEGKRQESGHCTDIVTSLAIEWLEGRDPEKPFVLMCQHKAPHRSWMPASRHLDLYDDIEIPEPKTLFDSLADNASPARFHEMGIDRELNLVYDLFLDPLKDGSSESTRALDAAGIRNLKRMTDTQRQAWNEAYSSENEAFVKAGLEGEELVRWKYQRYIKNYLRCVKGVDESVGRLMTYLEDSGLDDNTIVIYSSDQGFYLGDHGWFDKRWMYEESLSMPLIIKWPGVTEPGSISRDLVQNLDYAPTFLNMAELPIPDSMQGKSLVPLLQGQSPEDWRRSIYYHYYEFPGVHNVARQYGVRTERYKLIRFYQFDEWEFYDLKEDPDELTNSYSDPLYQDQVAVLKQELVALRNLYEDDGDDSPLSLDAQEKYRNGK